MSEHLAHDFGHARLTARSDAMKAIQAIPSPYEYGDPRSVVASLVQDGLGLHAARDVNDRTRAGVDEYGNILQTATMSGYDGVAKSSYSGEVVISSGVDGLNGIHLDLTATGRGSYLLDGEGRLLVYKRKSWREVSKLRAMILYLRLVDFTIDGQEE